MFAVLYMPDFHLQAALRWQEELFARAVAVTDAEGAVIEYTETAAAKNVNAGMDGVQAMARCPGLLLRPRVPAQELVVETTLLEIAGSLSPEVEATSPGCAT